MKRSPMPPRSGYMKRGGRIRTKGKRRFKGTDCPAFREWITTQRCIITGRHGNIDPAHLPVTKAKGAPDLGGIVPLWHVLHEEQHQHGLPAFLEKYEVTREGLRDLAALYAAEFLAGHPEHAGGA